MTKLTAPQTARLAQFTDGEPHLTNGASGRRVDHALIEKGLLEKAPEREVGYGKLQLTAAGREHLGLEPEAIAPVLTLTKKGVAKIAAHNGQTTEAVEAAATAAGYQLEGDAAEAPAKREARTWDTTAADTHRCAGACGEVLPAKAFPTVGREGRRGVVCRKDRDAARAARTA